jgi:hypothetical protein
MKPRMFQHNSRLSINISSKNACLSALRYNMQKRYYLRGAEIPHIAQGKWTYFSHC